MGVCSREVFLALGLVPCLLALLRIIDNELRASVLLSIGVATFGFYATKSIIPVLKPYTVRSNLFGYDINKKGTEAGEKKIPESLGLAPGVVFLVCIILTEQLHAFGISQWLRPGEGLPQWQPAPSRIDSWLIDYNAALATICFMLFLGFADDVLDIPWRVKLVLPLVASLPLLTAYGGGTGVAIPKPLRYMGLPGYLELGILYKAYMVALGIFCTNAINILAGINGLEVGQTLVIALAVACHNLIELGGAGGSNPTTQDAHLFSLILMAPLAGCTYGLAIFNWFPAQVFVGDTFTYFAGMAFAVAGVLGHFSETMLLFFAPQILNFVYSLPQLLKLVPCPRHRLPRYDPESKLLHATPNWNLVNLALAVGGPCSEPALNTRLLSFQTLCCLAAFGVRYGLTDLYK